MSTEHTPGPWIMQVIPVNRSVANLKVSYQIKGPENYYIGIIPENNDHPCNIANARLIAAAPDMFRILQELVREDRVEKGMWPEINELLNRIENV